MDLIIVPISLTLCIVSGKRQLYLFNGITHTKHDEGWEQRLTGIREGVAAGLSLMSVRD